MISKEELVKLAKEVLSGEKPNPQSALFIMYAATDMMYGHYEQIEKLLRDAQKGKV